MSQFATALRAFPVLDTPRLSLRRPEAGDAARYFALISALPPTSSWPSSYEAQNERNAEASIRSYNNAYERTKTVIPWVLMYDGQLIGLIKLFDIQNRGKGEVGYWLGQEYWSKGLVTEAVLAVADFAFQELGMHRLYASTLPQNLASQRVLEKCGFTLEGVLRLHTLRGEEWTDSLMYGRLAGEKTVS